MWAHAVSRPDVGGRVHAAGARDKLDRPAFFSRPPLVCTCPHISADRQELRQARQADGSAHLGNRGVAAPCV